MNDEYSEGYEAGLNRGNEDAGEVIDALEAENARLREQAEALAEALTRIAEGDAESYLSCPGVPICSRTHDDNCGVGIAVAALRAYRGADPPEGDDEYGMVKDAEQVADHLPPGWKL